MSFYHITNQNMINYHYFWYNIKINNILDTDNYNTNILNIFYKYSFPCCLNINTNLTEEDKCNIILNETKFICDKIDEYSYGKICIIQVPRIIYDLFNIYYQVVKNITFDSPIDHYNILFECNTFKKYCDFNTYIQSYNAKDIINMNSFFIKLYLKELQYFMKNKIEVPLDKWTEILNIIINEISKYNKILNDDIIKTILNETLKIELGIGIPHNKIILYRGSSVRNEKLIYNNNGKTFLSAFSYNTSILNGIFNDETACTLYYYKKDNYKLYYLLDKTFDSNIIFIPPIHPFFLLNMNGELWHARSKLPNRITDNKIKIKGLHKPKPLEFFLGYDYLISQLDSNNLEIEMNEKLSTNTYEILDKNFIKYLKYKNKYKKIKMI